MIQQGCIKPLVDLLDYTDTKLLQLVLDGITSILATGDDFDGVFALSLDGSLRNSSVDSQLHQHDDDNDHHPYLCREPLHWVG